MNARLTHRAEFCAALRLECPGSSAEENRALYGVCYSPNFHGHNYRLAVDVEGPVDPKSGLVMDFLQFGAIVDEAVVRPLDHKNLNLDVDFLQGVVPTTENLAICFWERLAARLPAGIELREIRLRESQQHSVTYRGPQPTP